jgi:hypothetical protein
MPINIIPGLNVSIALVCLMFGAMCSGIIYLMDSIFPESKTEA